jgi:Uncharacterised nucleotidyltransferase
LHLKKSQPLSRTLRPEYEVILLCSRLRPAPEAIRRIRHLIGDVLDWHCVIETALNHKVAPLLYKNLNSLSEPALPDDWMEILRKHYERNARRNIYLTAQLLRVLDALRAEHIPVIPYKGAVLAALAYGDVTLREFDDLDFMVPHEYVARAHRRLIADGFKTEHSLYAAPIAALPVPGQYSFQKDGGHCNLEFHTELTLRYYPRPLDIAGLISRSIPVPLGGSLVPSLSPESLLLALAVHGSKHFWDRLNWICDFAELLKLETGVQWEQALEQAHRFGCERMVLLGSALAKELLNVELPGPIAARLNEIPQVRSLSQRLASKLFSDTPNVAGLAERFFIRVQLSQSLGQGLRYCYKLGKMPSEEDLEWAPWAKNAAPVYRLLRPLRLLRKYGTGLFHRPAANRLR